MTIFSFQDSLLHCLRRRIGSIINLRGQNCCPGSPNLPLGNLTRRRRAKYCLAASQAFSLWTISDNFGVRRIMWKWLWKMISLSFKLKSVFLRKHFGKSVHSKNFKNCPIETKKINGQFLQFSAYRTNHITDLLLDLLLYNRLLKKLRDW